MEQDIHLESSVHGQNLIVSSSQNNIISISQHNHPEPSSSSHGTKRRHSQSTEPSLEPDPKRSNEANETCSTDSENLLHRFEQAVLLIKVLRDKIEEKDMELKQKQTECEQKDNHLKVYFSLINKLEEDCNEKNKQLAEKDALIDQLKSEVIAKNKFLAAFSEKLRENSAKIDELQTQSNNKNTQLTDMECKIKRLEAEMVNKNAQLQSKSAEICELQTQSNGKDTQLTENDRLISELKEACVEKDKQLEEKANAINNLQAHCNDKETQLVKKTFLVEQLQSQCVENESQTQVIPEKLKNLKDNVNNYFETLFDRANKCCDQNQHEKALTIYDNAIEFERLTQNRSDKLDMLRGKEFFCRQELKNCQQAVDVTTLSLQCDSNQKLTLEIRTRAYADPEQCSNACQDLERVLHSDSADGDSQRQLEKLQECFNEVTSLIASQ